MLRKALVLVLAFALAGLGACAPAAGSGGSGGTDRGAGGKGDSGWLADTSYEVNAVFRARVTTEATGEWENLANDPELQVNLIDLQVKYAKNTAEGHGWRLNQLVDEFQVLDVATDGANVTLTYEAVIDMIGEIRSGAEAPSLDEIDPRTFPVALPVNPIGVYRRVGSACANDRTATEYNYHYYFDPDRAGCDLELERGEIEVVEVFERKTVYPEYDRLLNELPDGSKGFRAALVPAYGDSDPRSRFTAHARMLEDELGLEGVAAEDGSYVRYEWRNGDVTIVIDLFDPTVQDYSAQFREALGGYELVFYNGHSSYGTKDLLSDPASFSERYQIIMLHSCQSYAYYTRQVFRAKETPEDPTGFDLADMVATGRSSYPTDSAPTLQALLEGLMEGLVAVTSGDPSDAPDWLKIVRRMNSQTYGILYGVAGVRTNRWQP